ncbi:MAG TPA: hypothetical protein PKD34_01155 [Candidatus Doudnabacteria bacterium]|nr:hypothetical protein [Candidatus Doudnabacteria bacterium]
MILESVEAATEKVETQTSLGKDLGKLALALILLGSAIVVSMWCFLHFGSYGSRWYALFYIATALVYNLITVGFLYWLDPRFYD